MSLRALRPYILAIVLTLPGLALRFAHPDLSPIWVAVLSGIAILGASFLLTWACEVAQLDIPQAVAVAVVAFIAVLPEYAVDMYFTWMAGQHPESAYSHYAIANMTGANRLLIGVGWSAIVLIFAGRYHSAVALHDDKRTDVLFLGLATLYALLIPLKGSLTWVDGVVFLAIYAWYIWIIARRPCEEEQPEGPAAVLAQLPKKRRLRTVIAIFLFAALVILCNAEPFSESLVASGKLLGVNEFLLVQWLAPIASEAPEFIVALMFAFRGNAGLALGSLLSSKLNQWTLLVGLIPGVYAVSSGGLSPSINLDTHQFQEILLTAGQSIFAVALLLDLRLHVREAFWLLVLFAAQLLSPLYDAQLEAMLGLAHDPLRLHYFSHIRAIPPTAAGWLLILLLACACIPAAFSPAGATEETPPPADSAAPDTEDSGPEQAVYPDVLNEHIQRGGNGNPAVSLYYPVLHQTAVDEAIRRWATDVADAYEKEVGKADGPDGEKPSSYGMWDLTGLFELTRPSEGVVSVTFSVYSYTGGAHGNLEITCLNYDLRTGRRLDLADLFKDPERPCN